MSPSIAYATLVHITEQTPTSTHIAKLLPFSRFPISASPHHILFSSSLIILHFQYPQLHAQPISPFPLTLRGGPPAQIALQPPFTPPPANEVPPLMIPTATTIIIAEESPEASTSVDLYRGTVASVGDDVESVEEVAPMWLLEFLLKVGRIHTILGT